MLWLKYYSKWLHLNKIIIYDSNDKIAEILLMWANNKTSYYSTVTTLAKFLG